MPPIVETRLWDGAQIDWTKRRTTKSVRCIGCGTVHPGPYMREVDKLTGLCMGCREKVSHGDIS